jgi:hypothetical protein
VPRTEFEGPFSLRRFEQDFGLTSGPQFPWEQFSHFRYGNVSEFVRLQFMQNSAIDSAFGKTLVAA